MRTSNQPHILCVEDEPRLQRLLLKILTEGGLSGTVKGTGKEFLEVLATTPVDLCLIDLHLPDTSGLDLLREMSEKFSSTPAVVLTGSGSLEDAVAAMKLGAVDYLTKPIEFQRLLVSLKNSLRLRRCQSDLNRLQSDLTHAYAPRNLVGTSERIEAVRDSIRRAAPADVSVLIRGETGTGKELVARSLHFSSPRGSRPFIDVNCAALTETLLESELFGHEKGAFTGATSQRRGQFEQADGGTLFLDEIGDMPASTQTKILRVLQEGRLKRVGGDKLIEVDVRVVCATHRDLEEEIKQGRFLQDLLYRINTFAIEIPPLRDRSSDIPELARHFLTKVCKKQKRAVPKLPVKTIQSFMNHPWPGNARELEHVMERAVLLCDGEDILPEHLPPQILGEKSEENPASPTEGLVKAVEHLERTMIHEALEKHGWVKSRAANALGITERIISYKIINLGIQRPPS